MHSRAAWESSAGSARSVDGLYIETPGPLRTTVDVSEGDGSSAGQATTRYLYSQTPVAGHA
jgi:hypothetical protein